MVKTVEHWMRILTPFTDSATDAAYLVLGNLCHYEAGRVLEADDCRQLANALTAWAALQNASKAAP